MQSIEHWSGSNALKLGGGQFNSQSGQDFLIRKGKPNDFLLKLNVIKKRKQFRVKNNDS